MIWFRALPLLWQLGIELALVVGLAVAFSLWKNSIREEGRNEIRAQVAAAAAKREKEAQRNIIKIGENHAKIRQKTRMERGYNDPASPLASDAVDRVSGARSLASVRSGGAMPHTRGTR